MKHTLDLRKIALLAGAALLSTSAMAAPMEKAVTRTETVKYSVPKAATSEGAVALYQKLHDAAARVCGEADVVAGFTAAMSYTNCVSDALDKAVQQIGIPMVSALHLQSLASGAMSAANAKVMPGKAGTVASR